MSDTTTCAVVGGGPAGLFLGLMLARAGVDVTVLEKHADFLRDFRGDTVHPVTMRLLDQLGLFERFNRLPHSVVERGQFDVDGNLYTLVDFSRLRSQPHPYVAMVPQWDLLDLIADAAQDEPTFTLLMQHDVTGLLRDGDRVTGVRYTSPMAQANSAPTLSWDATDVHRPCGEMPDCPSRTTRCRSMCGGSGCPAISRRSSR